MCGSNVRPTIEMKSMLRSIDSINTDVIKTDDAINYFGVPADLAYALQLRVSDIQNWGEYVPQYYARRINKIIERDAQAASHQSQSI